MSVLEEKISVIVPVYNVEKYLDKCVETIVRQTYKNLEIILVDDGSTDLSGQLGEKWCQKDKRVQVIHKKNGGLSDARNCGIKRAIGKYLFFVDSDDYLEIDIIENLYKSALENQAQIATGGFIYETDSEQTPYYAKENYVADSAEMLKRMLTDQDISSAIWDKLYQKDLFEDLEFPVGKIHEDMAILYRLFDKAERISHIDKAGYHYVQRQGSIIYGQFSAAKLSIVEFKEDILKFVERKYPNLVEEAEIFFVQQLNKSILQCQKNGLQTEYQFWKNRLKEYIIRILKNSKMRWKTKMKSMMILSGMGCFLKR